MKSFQSQTHYEVLEISVGATLAEVKSAYERLSRLYSDDQVVLYGLIDPHRANALRARLKEALEVLGDDARRDAYDVKIGLPPREGPKKAPAPKPVVQSSGASAVAGTGWGAFAFVTPPVSVPVAAQPTSYTYTMNAQSAPVAVQPAAVVPAPVIAAPAPVVAPPPVTVAPPPVAVVFSPEPVPAASPAEELQQLDLGMNPGPLNVWGARAPEPILDPPTPAAPVPAPPALTPVPPPLPQVVAPPPPPASAPFEVMVVAPSAPVPPPLPVAPPPEVVEAAPEPELPRLSDEVEVAIIPARASPAREFRIEQRPRPYEVPEDVEFNGDLLRQVRMARGLTLVQLAERTRIGLKHLENVEGDRYDALPVGVYLRGILMNLARELGLDGLKVSKSYLTFVEAHRSKD